MTSRTLSHISRPQRAQAVAKALPSMKLGFNVDAVAIALALALAALVRLNVLSRIGW